MANLVIMESPSKANTVKSYLGSNYKVIASVGHIRDLPKSSLGVDIENGFEAHYINIRGKGEVIKEIKKEAKNANKIFLATDPDREGEAISWHLAQALGIPLEKTQRVEFNEITKNVVKAAIKKPRNIDMSLVDAQQARRILDRIVGYKISPLLWKNVKSGLSAGRVQSVATRIIVEREEEIKSFVPVEYWTIEVTLVSNDDGKEFTVRFFGNENGKMELGCEAEAMAVVNAVAGKQFKVTGVKRSTRHKAPQPPFTTSTLQQEGYRKLGFQSQRTMRTAQELYEGINIGSENGGVQGLITYMRTDSLRVSAEAQDAARAYIADKFGDKYNTAEPRVYKSKSGIQDAHEAIRPANVNLEPKKIKSHLTPDQYKLYKLIWDRFVASQMESATLATLNVEVESAGYVFRTGGYTVTFQGYMAVYEDSSDDAADGEEQKNAKIPEMSEGELLEQNRIDPTKHFTEPPPRFNEGSLVKFLEEKGIGRPSTFESTITTITSRNYVKREGKNKVLVPTPLGEITTKLMKENFDSIVDYEFTAEMENKLDAIEKGEQSLGGVLTDFWGDFSKQLEVATEKLSELNIELPVEETDIICDKCGSRMVVKNGRFGKFAACPNYPRCRNTKPLTATKPEDEVEVEADAQAEEKKAPEKKVVVANFKCDKCGADMVLRTGRFGSFYACANYPACRNTKQKTKEIGVPCPECGAKIVTRYSRSKTAFYGCERYPECKFSSWDMPMEKKCPDCGKNLFHKKGKPQLICHDENCGYTEPYTAPEKSDDGEEN